MLPFLAVFLIGFLAGGFVGNRYGYERCAKNNICTPLAPTWDYRMK